MKTVQHLFWAFCSLVSMELSAQSKFSQNQVRTQNGIVEGTYTAKTKVTTFKGIPFAAPPVGDLRWKEPQPAANWEGVRKADTFGPKAMQKPIFGDMGFRANGMSEDCLYLNVWTPASSSNEKLPVLVYFYGGGLMAGDGSEPRYDGEAMAAKGIVSVTINYRLGVFGFFAHPELTKESAHHSSSNYGYLDQTAALQWVKANIAAFGGDPNKVTIAGESAGSISVSVQMASPLAKGLIAGAIGESGAAINPTLVPIPLADGEKNGVKFGEIVGAKTLAELRAIPAEKLLDLAFKPGNPPMSATIDGYLLPKSLVEIFNAKEQANIPLLVGWNSAEIPYMALLRGKTPTPENYAAAVKEQFPKEYEAILKVYPGNNEQEILENATALASDRFISYSTWKWADLHARNSEQPVFRYLFSRVRPAMTAKMGNAQPGLAGGVVKGDPNKKPEPPKFEGASHASEIEYALGNLPLNDVYAWTPDDYKVSETMLNYFANFVKKGNPNGAKLPNWDAIKDPKLPVFMDINVKSAQKVDQTNARYELLDSIYNK
ncbi:para-nitrobenzyl esterase [Chitinophaga skermanii]|uniref:Carboxylic ester hydrolase n=1 Tax=Chitinophaga skermanii TaxID=331697 RepID=A0A327QVW5_9BACT|nr:carboxylesterase family protein [Chitinophaga skermanii]RAJ08806.1 para-nitrobenzyl esterase [Chitinophaga skermanii]